MIRTTPYGQITLRDTYDRTTTNIMCTRLLQQAMMRHRYQNAASGSSSVDLGRHDRGLASCRAILYGIYSVISVLSFSSTAQQYPSSAWRSEKASLPFVARLPGLFFFILIGMMEKSPLDSRDVTYRCLEKPNIGQSNV